MEFDEGKKLILKAFCDLAWADGRVVQAQADFIAELAEQMDLPLGVWLPLILTGLSRSSAGVQQGLALVPLDEVERYQVVERFMEFCLIGKDLSTRQAEILAELSLQFGIKAEELEEMRRRLC